jgi:flagella basal body P-ring formation protein FlgA
MKRILFVIIFLSIIMQLFTISLKLKTSLMINNELIRVHDLVLSYEGNENDYEQIKNVIVHKMKHSQRLLNIKSSHVLEVLNNQRPSINVEISNNVVSVKWDETILGEDIIKSKAVDYVKKYYSLSADAKVVVLNIPKIMIPKNNVNIEFEVNKFQQNSNYTRLDGKVLYLDDIVSVFNVLVKIEEKVSTYQASRSIKKGEKINRDDFILVNISTGNINVFVENLDDLGEMIASTFISKGSILKKESIKSAPFVKRNELVNVLVESSSMSLVYQAISKEDGWQQNYIILANPESKQEFVARVIEKNKVIILLED